MVTQARKSIGVASVSMATAVVGMGLIGIAAIQGPMSERSAHGAVPAGQARESAMADIPEADWTEHLILVNLAIDAGNASRAIYAWREAYGAALRSRRWEALILVGDAGARLERLMGSTGRYRAEARQAYLGALFRARAQGSAEGMRRAADGFEALGDEEAAALARRMPGRPS